MAAPNTRPTIPKHGMVLSAGLGLRMRPVTEKIPKPLVEIAGRTLLDRVLDQFEEAGVTDVLVNTHYKADMIARHLDGRVKPRIEISHEDELLETGGGVKKALNAFGDAPFFVANSDALWVDGPQLALHRLALQWDPKKMDALLLVFPTVTAFGYAGEGDFFCAPDGVLRRRKEGEISPFLFTGVQMLHPRVFQGTPDGRFSLNVVYDKAAAAGRLFGVRHDGLWFHVGTPDDIEPTSRELSHLHVDN